MDYEHKYNNLFYDYQKLKTQYAELKEDYEKLQDDLSSANFKLETELEPRIRREKRAYDNWVTNPER